MSGFNRGHFELTATKASYWHGCRKSNRDCHHSRGFWEIVDAHAVPAGFTVVTRRSAFVVLSGPGISEGKTRELFAALSGWPLEDCADR